MSLTFFDTKMRGFIRPTLRIDKSIWDEFKDRVPRSSSLNKTVSDMIADFNRKKRLI